MTFNFRTISIFLVLVVLSRATIPVGYMVSSAERADGISLQLNLCPSQNNFDLNEATPNITVSPHQQMVSHGYTGHHPVPEKYQDNRHKEHSDKLISHEICYLWVASSPNLANTEKALWLSDPIFFKALSVYRAITPNRNFYNQKQTRAPPVKTLS